jgi:hypothetical protein
MDAAAVDAALDGLGDRAVVLQWAQRFSVLADPSRLTLLVCIHYARENPGVPRGKLGARSRSPVRSRHDRAAR